LREEILLPTTHSGFDISKDLFSVSNKVLDAYNTICSRNGEVVVSSSLSKVVGNLIPAIRPDPTVLTSEDLPLRDVTSKGLPVPPLLGVTAAKITPSKEDGLESTTLTARLSA
jgi:hypothetical protein